MPSSSDRKEDYQKSLKATGITGLAQIFQIAIKIINTKVVAILLGPAGVGIIGLFQSSVVLISTVSGLGLGNSAVRDVAKADKEGDSERISLTIQSLRRLVWITGTAGAIFCLLAGGWLSRISFNSDEYSLSFRILGLMVLLNQVSAGQLALLQGLRKLKELALVSVIGSAAGLAVACPLYWWFGISGIVPALILLSIVPVLVAYFYSSRITLASLPFSLEKFRETALPMLKLGASTMLSSLALVLVMWLIRIMVQRKFGLQGVGQFQAGWGVTTIYLQMIFQAMGRDYYPRLSGHAGDKSGMQKLVNQQLHLALLLGTPLLLLAMTAAPLIIRLLYSSSFQGAVSQLQWLAFGTLFKLISWPLGFVLLALRKSTVYLITECISSAIFLILTIGLTDIFGLDGIGLAYSLNYILYAGIVLISARKFIRFGFDGDSIQFLIISTLACIIVFYSVFVRQNTLIFFTSVTVTTGVSAFYLVKLNQLTGILKSLWVRIR